MKSYLIDNDFKRNFDGLREAKVEVGDIVVDPMCGGGSIPIEGSLTYSNAFYVGGDFHEKALERFDDHFLFSFEN